jgi:uncharacterized protein involved in propanediol utilization
VIETAESNSAALESILKAHGIENAEMKIAEECAKVAISVGEHGALVGILRDIHFDSRMSVQDLEKEIFSHIQKHEMQRLLRGDSEVHAEEADVHPRV